MKNYILLIFSVFVIAFTSACDHKDIELEDDLNRTSSGRTVIVYDWRYAPDANPASMELCLYPHGQPEHLSFNLLGRDGGEISLPNGTYDAISMNNDDLDWALYRRTNDKDDFEVYTHNAEEFGAYKYLCNYLNKTRADESARLAATPEMSWSTRHNEITVTDTDGDQIITLYPREIVCHYTVTVQNVKNIDSARGEVLNGTLSGMAEGYRHGSSISTDTPVTMPFTMTADVSSNSLHGEFFTFGECNSVKAKHELRVFLFLSDGSVFEHSFDVDRQVAEAPDPTHVNIIVSGLEFPENEPSGGLEPEVKDWNTEVIDIGM